MEVLIICWKKYIHLETQSLCSLILVSYKLNSLAIIIENLSCNEYNYIEKESKNSEPSSSNQTSASLTEQIQSLQKQTKLLTEKVISLEQVKLQGIIDRIEQLENESKHIHDGVKVQDTSKLAETMTDRQTHNRKLLERATCDQVGLWHECCVYSNKTQAKKI